MDKSMDVKKHIEKEYLVEIPIDKQEDAIRFVIDNFHDLDREVFFTIQLDSEDKPINFTIQHMGSVDRSVISPREVFKTALLSNATSIVLLHNHPSGSVVFSEADIRATEALRIAALNVGIEVKDHYIFTPSKEYLGLKKTREIYKTHQAELNFGSKYSFNDVRVRQTNYLQEFETIENPFDLLRHYDYFKEDEASDLMLILLDNQSRVRKLSLMNTGVFITEGGNDLLSDIFINAVLKNTTRILLAYKDSIHNFLPVQDKFIQRINNTSQSLEIQLLDVVSLSDHGIESLRMDYPELANIYFINEHGSTSMLEKGEIIDMKKLQEMNHEELIKLIKEIKDIDYRAYFKAFVSIEGNIEQDVILDLAYEAYMEDDSISGLLDDFIAQAIPFSPMTHREFADEITQTLEKMDSNTHVFKLENAVSRDDIPTFSLVNTEMFVAEDLEYLGKTVTYVANGQLTASLLPNGSFVNSQAIYNVMEVINESIGLGDISSVQITNYLDEHYPSILSEFEPPSLNLEEALEVDLDDSEELTELSKLLKEQQLKIINESNPMQNDNNVGIREVKDIKTLKEAYDIDEADGEINAWLDQPEELYKEAFNTGVITVYSSKDINRGDFVSTSFTEALQYAGGKPDMVNSKTIPINDVAWINTSEGQYAPVHLEFDHEAISTSYSSGKDLQRSLTIGDVIINTGDSVSLISDKELGPIIVSGIEKNIHYSVTDYSEEKDSYSLKSLNESKPSYFSVDKESLINEFQSNSTILGYEQKEYELLHGIDREIKWTDDNHKLIFNDYQSEFEGTDKQIVSMSVQDVSNDNGGVLRDKIVVSLNDGSSGHFSSEDTSALSEVLSNQLSYNNDISVSKQNAVSLKP